ncbi:MAG: metalloregulator ArsR/SmtB family transcription factor [Planctomycetes bacterium]|jgi:arsenate reductase|nr:metalloregulator ArsR/SmtB family transcription factor [Planctomycetota bacterium]
MEPSAAIAAFGALAHPARLAVFRALARGGRPGLCAGELARRTGLPASTLSFHLRDLGTAGLVHGERRGRSIVYTLQAARLRELLWFLGEDCCQGRLELLTSPLARIEHGAEGSHTRDRRPVVLFVCGANSARSQLGEALLRHRAGDRFEILSAGLQPGTVHPLVAPVLAERKVPSDGLVAKDLGQLLGRHAIDHAIVLCPEAEQECRRVSPFARQLHAWPLPDPAAAAARQQRAAFRSTRDELLRRIDVWLATDPDRTPNLPRRNSA